MAILFSKKRPKTPSQQKNTFQQNRIQKQNLSAKQVSAEEYSRLKQWYSDEIKRKDRIIDELKQENGLLMKTALKRSAEHEKIKHILDEIKKKELTKR